MHWFRYFWSSRNWQTWPQFHGSPCCLSLFLNLLTVYTHLASLLCKKAGELLWGF
jgi:hypothetical protein